MTQVSQTLFTGQDNFELVREQVVAILKAEALNQRNKSAAGSSDFDFDITTERSNPWESFRDTDDPPPIINVWLDTLSYDKSSSNATDRAASDAVYNIDCYGQGKSVVTDNGHAPGDRQASLEMQRAYRFVRRTIMASYNKTLQLPDIVWQRWLQSMAVYQPQLDTRPAEHAIACRIRLEVKFNELAPVFTGETLEEVNIDGGIVSAKYTYPLEV